MKKTLILIVIILWTLCHLHAQNEEEKLTQYKDLYQQGLGKLNEAFGLSPREADNLLEESKSFLEQANEVAKTLDPTEYAHKRGRTHLNIGRIYFEQMDYEQAESSLQRGLREMPQTSYGEYSPENLTCYAQLYIELGRLSIEKEDLRLARIYMKEAYDVYQYLFTIKSEPDFFDHYYSGIIGQQLGGIYTRLAIIDKGRKKIYADSAKSYLQLALPYSRVMPYAEMPGYAEALEQLEQDIQITLSNSFYLAGDLESAENAYLDLTSNTEDPLMKAHVHNNLGIIYRKMGKSTFSKAARNLGLAKAIYENLGESLEIAGLWENIGDLYQDQDLLDSALFAYHQAIIQVVPEFNDPDVNKNPDVPVDLLNRYGKELATYLASKAKIFGMQAQEISDENERASKLEIAAKTYELAVAQAEYLQKDFLIDESKAFFQAEVFSIYEGAIELAASYTNEQTINSLAADFNTIARLAFQQFSFDQIDPVKLAFNYAEKSKIGLQLAQLRGQKLGNDRLIPSAILEKENSLKRELNRYRKLIGITPEGDERSEYERAYKGFFLKYQALLDTISKEHKEYYRLKYEKEAVSIETLQKNLPQNTSLLEYFVGEEGIFVFHITPTLAEMKKVEISSDTLDYLVTALLDSLKIGKMKLGKERTYYGEKASRLYDYLVKPFESQLLDHLLIIPDGSLTNLPFEILLTEDPQGKAIENYLELYLIHNKAISYAGSATLWREFQAKPRYWQNNELIAFRPTFEPIDEYQKYTLGIQELTPLNASKAEVDSILQLFGGKILEGIEATLKNFEEQVANYGIIHLSTHSKFWADNPNLNWIAFTPIPDSINNELLFLIDIFGLKLKAKLVVLSSCEGSVDKATRGVGLTSLAQGFSQAGAQSIVATLWSVPDTTNAEVMKYFYKYLKEGDNKAEAMQKAKIDFLTNFHAFNEDYKARTDTSLFLTPQMWAGPIVIGDISPIQQTNWFLIILISLFSLLLIGYIFYRKKLYLRE